MDKNRTNALNPVSALAAVLLLGMFASGYAISTQMEGTADAAQSRNPLLSAPVQDQAPSAYFPAQYVNQAQHAEEHIQAF